MTSISFNGENCGKYTWQITDDQLLHKILNADNEQLFESNPFVMTNLKWKLQIYPNGWNYSTKGSVHILLIPMSMPSDLDQIVLTYSIRCNKTMSSWTKIKSYKNGVKAVDIVKDEKKQNVLLLSEWCSMNLNDLSIMVAIKINCIVLKNKNNNNNNSKLVSSLTQQPPNLDAINYKKKYNFVYLIDNQTMSVIKNSYNGKRLESQIFDNMWQLSYYPNGSDVQYVGYFSIYIRLCVLQSCVSKISIKCNIKCVETDIVKSGSCQYSITAQSIGFTKFCELKKIDSFDTLTFMIDIEIKNIVFVDDADRYKNHIYDQTQIENILSLMSTDCIEDVEMSESNKYVNYLELDDYMINIDDGSLNKLSTAQLIQRLKSHNLPINGLKHELVQTWKKYKLDKQNIL